MHVLQGRLIRKTSAIARASSSIKLGVAAFATGAMIVAGASGAAAKGGTAKPPAGGGGGAVPTTPLVNILPPAGPTLPIVQPGSAGFGVTGFIQAATVTGGCPAAPGSTAGGTVTINGIVYTIPTNLIIQFPANTLTWADAVCPTAAGVSALALNGTDGGAGFLYPSTELSLAGNIVNPGGGLAGIGSNHIVALAWATQQSLNSASGYISFIDYTDGSIYVSSGAAGETRLLINDPNGRFGRKLTTSDVRFSVDDANPTIKTAASGYPMCVPRIADELGGVIPLVGGVPDDPRCPIKNRPVSNGAAGSCRNFQAAGIVPIGGELTTTPAGRPCSAFVMKAIVGMPGAAAAAAVSPANVVTLVGGETPVNEPDPRKMVPFQVGDFISWNGTLVRGGNASPPASTRATTTGGPGAGDVIWVHTIDANVGAYTQPSTLPAYVAVGGFVVGVDPFPTGVNAAVGAELTARISLEASVSDIGSVLDLYWDDKGPAPGFERFRWLTPESMTGTLTFQTTVKGGAVPPKAISVQPFGGGITTQFDGPQPGRARIRANKVPAINPALGCTAAGGSQGCAVTQSPSRYLRATLRSLCAPAPGSPANNPAGNPGSLDGGAFFDINGNRANLPTASNGGTGSATDSGVTAGNGTCLQSAQFANGLFTGQYMAPVGEYIFGENTLAGSAIIPANIWQLDFLVRGESGGPGESQPAAPGAPSAQSPSPW